MRSVPSGISDKPAKKILVYSGPAAEYYGPKGKETSKSYAYLHMSLLWSLAVELGGAILFTCRASGAVRESWYKLALGAFWFH
jgi:hypothetical protein